VSVWLGVGVGVMRRVGEGDGNAVCTSQVTQSVLLGCGVEVAVLVAVAVAVGRRVTHSAVQGCTVGVGRQFTVVAPQGPVVDALPGPGLASTAGAARTAPPQASVAPAQASARARRNPPTAGMDRSYGRCAGADRTSGGTRVTACPRARPLAVL
jgi:hypothetical protein